MLIKKLLFSILVLQINEVLSKRNCNDCQLLTTCNEAMDLNRFKQDHDTRKLFLNAFCGWETDDDEMRPKVCCSDFQPLFKPPLDLTNDSAARLLPKKCGTILSSRLLGGQRSFPNQYSWTALIAYKTRDGPQFQCGGSVINSKYILTAAHCVLDKEIEGVRVGEYDTTTDRDCDYSPLYSCADHVQDFHVVTLIPHEKYDKSTHLNDIALLRLGGEINFNNKVCNSCMMISQCKTAIDLSYKRDHETMKLFEEAFCGFQQYNGQLYFKVCCSDFLPFEKRKENLLPNVCGSISGNRIIGGRKADLGEFPWMAVIRYKDSNRMCAGSVINSKYILTAAHCVINFPIDYVRVGEYNLYEDPDCEYLPGNIVNCRPHIEMKVAKFIIHEQYQSWPSKYNDIALLRLDGVIDFQKSGVEPICLPVSSELRNKKLALKTGIVTGWGYTEYNEPSEVLLKVKVPVNRKCYAVNSLCAGKKNKDSCIGDSGGPLMMTDFYNNVSSYIQYGIVSHGPKKCGSSNKGAVYVDVRKYVKWILDNLRE